MHNSDVIEFGNDKKYIVDNSIPGLAKHLRMLGVDTLFETSYTQNYVLFLACRDDRIIITQSVKMVHAIEQMRNNREKKREKLVEYQKLLHESTERTDNAVEPVQGKRLLFMHEVHRWKPLSPEQLIERIEVLREELEQDEQLRYEYKFFHLKCRGREEQLTKVVNHFKIKFLPERLFKRCGKCNGETVEVEKESIKDDVDQNTYDDNNQFARCTSCAQIFWGILPNNPMQQEAYQKAVKFCTRYSYHPNDQS